MATELGVIRPKCTGIILTNGMLIAPGAMAFLLTKRFGPMLLTSVAVAVSASLIGVHLSFFIDSAPAPTPLLLTTITFVAAFLWSSLSAQVDLTAQASVR